MPETNVQMNIADEQYVTTMTKGSFKAREPQSMSVFKSMILCYNGSEFV